MDYRDDDRRSPGYCPVCGGEIHSVSVEGFGYCGDCAVRVAVDWEPRQPVDPAVLNDNDGRLT